MVVVGQWYSALLISARLAQISGGQDLHDLWRNEGPQGTIVSFNAL
jgi:hypothetical protein